MRDDSTNISYKLMVRYSQACLGTAQSIFQLLTLSKSLALLQFSHILEDAILLPSTCLNLICVGDSPNFLCLYSYLSIYRPAKRNHLGGGSPAIQPVCVDCSEEFMLQRSVRFATLLPTQPLNLPKLSTYVIQHKTWAPSASLGRLALRRLP